MIFDSKEQKQRVIDLIGEVPINTNIAGLASGPSPEMVALLQALESGVVLPVESQIDLMLKLNGQGGEPDEAEETEH